MVNDSILDTIKCQLGDEPDNDSFDRELIPQINAVLMILHQLNVGPKIPIMIEDSSTTWGELVSDPRIEGLVETYVYLKTRMIFDPPTSTSVMEATKSMIAELESRILLVSDEPTITDDSKPKV